MLCSAKSNPNPQIPLVHCEIKHMKWNPSCLQHCCQLDFSAKDVRCAVLTCGLCDAGRLRCYTLAFATLMLLFFLNVIVQQVTALPPYIQLSHALILLRSFLLPPPPRFPSLAHRVSFLFTNASFSATLIFPLKLRLLTLSLSLPSLAGASKAGPRAANLRSARDPTSGT